jgi:hypothetical protein
MFAARGNNLLTLRELKFIINNFKRWKEKRWESEAGSCQLSHFEKGFKK